MRCWSPDEDKLLLQLISENGQHWKQIAALFGEANPRVRVLLMRTQPLRGSTCSAHGAPELWPAARARQRPPFACRSQSADAPLLTPIRLLRMTHLLTDACLLFCPSVDGRASPSPQTPAMVRNRFMRLMKGRELASKGGARNKCGKCGALKRGHVCGVSGEVPFSLPEQQPRRARQAAAQLSPSEPTSAGAGQLLAAAATVVGVRSDPAGVAGGAPLSPFGLLQQPSPTPEHAAAFAAAAFPASPAAHTSMLAMVLSESPGAPSPDSSRVNDYFSQSPIQMPASLSEQPLLTVGEVGVEMPASSPVLLQAP
jgi:hypothetical protein